jgi:hypothetical protein
VCCDYGGLDRIGLVATLLLRLWGFPSHSWTNVLHFLVVVYIVIYVSVIKQMVWYLFIYFTF